MLSIVTLLLLSACEPALPEPVLATVGGGEVSHAEPPTEQLVLLAPDELVLSLPGITDAGPEGTEAWMPFVRGGDLRLPLVDGWVDARGEKALQALTSGLQPADSELVVRAHGALPARTLLQLQDALRWGRFATLHLQVDTEQGPGWLAVDFAGSSFRGVFLSAGGVTPMAHRVGVPAYEPPATDELEARTAALIGHYEARGGHSVLILLEPERIEIQRALAAASALPPPRMMGTEDPSATYRRLQDIKHPQRPAVAIDRLEPSLLDAADPAAHDALIRLQNALVRPGLLELMPCYLAALEGEPTLAGRLRVDLVAKPGEALGVKAHGLGDELLHDCVAEAVGRTVGELDAPEMTVTVVVTMEASEVAR